MPNHFQSVGNPVLNHLPALEHWRKRLSCIIQRQKAHTIQSRLGRLINRQYPAGGGFLDQYALLTQPVVVYGPVAEMDDFDPSP